MHSCGRSQFRPHYHDKAWLAGWNCGFCRSLLAFPSQDCDALTAFADRLTGTTKVKYTLRKAAAKCLSRWFQRLFHSLSCLDLILSIRSKPCFIADLIPFRAQRGSQDFCWNCLLSLLGMLGYILKKKVQL